MPIDNGEEIDEKGNELIALRFENIRFSRVILEIAKLTYVTTIFISLLAKCWWFVKINP